MIRPRGYRPASLHGAVLLSLLLVTLALIGLVEYACQVLPKVDNNGSIKEMLGLQERSLIRRGSHPASATLNAFIQVDGVPDIVISAQLMAPGPLSRLLPRNPVAQVVSASASVPNVLSQPKPGGTSAPAPNAYLNTKVTSSQPAGTSAPAPNAYLNTKITSVQSTAPSAPAPNAYLNTKATSSQPAGSSAPAPNAYLNTKSSPTQPFIASTPNPNAYLNTKSTSTLPLIRSSANPENYLNTKGRSTITSTPSGTLAPDPNNYLHTTTPPNPTAPNKNVYLMSMSKITNAGNYFIGSYLPTIVAVLFAIPFVFVNRASQAIEPFYQLSKPEGAPAGSTLTMDYASLTAPFTALYYGQWAVVASSTLVGLSTLVVPLAAEAVSIHTVDTCNANTEGGCEGHMAISMPVARCVEAILSLIGIVLIVLMILLRMRRTRNGVFSEPCSIAGLAILLAYSDIRAELTATVPQATNKQLERALRTYTYKLQMGISPDGSTGLGLVKAAGYVSSPAPYQAKHEYATLEFQKRLVPSYRLPASVFSVFLIGLITLIIVYRFTGGDTGFEKFMNSQGFGARLLFTVVGVGISLCWTKIFQDIALLAPYRALAKGHATAEQSILTKPPSHALTAIYSAIARKHYVLATTAIAVILSQVLTVALAAIPFSSANLWKAYNASTWVCVSIIALMILTLALLFFYEEPDLPLKPNTIAAHFVYLAQSRLPDTFRYLAMSDTKTRNKSIRATGYRYMLENLQGYDGVARLTIDVEPVPYVS